MNRWLQITRLFADALDMDESSREAWLEKATPLRLQSQLHSSMRPSAALRCAQAVLRVMGG